MKVQRKSHSCKSRLHACKHVSHRACEMKTGIDSSRNDMHASLFPQEQSTLSRYSSLPWELRHHVHIFCVQGSYDNEVVVRRGTESRPNLLVRHSTGPHSYQWIKDSTLQRLGPDRVGVTAAREILQTYYRTRTFKFTHDELSTLEQFLEADTFDLSMRPADHVQRLHLQIQPFQYARLRKSDAMSKEERTCREALESLQNLYSTRAAIEIHADLAQGFCDDEEYNELLEEAAGFIFRTIDLVRRLQKEGTRIELALEGRWDGKNGTIVSHGSSPSLNDCIMSMKVACQ